MENEQKSINFLKRQKMNLKLAMQCSFQNKDSRNAIACNDGNMCFKRPDLISLT